MGKFVAIIGGLVAMVGGILLIAFVWWSPFVILLKGCIPPILFFGGLIALIAGVSSLKDAARTKQLEAEAQDSGKKTPPAA
jgi:hypothetical protein